MSEIKLTLVSSDSREARVVTSGTPAADLYGEDRTTVAARVNGARVDLNRVLADGDVVEPVAADSPDCLSIIRHSCAHVLAQAVQEINPKAKLGIGPPIRDGFYYDFDVDTPFTPDDLKNLEKSMQRIIKDGQLFSRRVVTETEARTELAAEPYKLELIGLKGGSDADDAWKHQGTEAEGERRAPGDEGKGLHARLR